MEKIVLGSIAKPFGLLGEIKVQVVTNNIKNLLNLKKCYIGGAEYKILTVREHAGFLFCKFFGIDNIDDAQKLQFKEFAVDRADADALNEGEFYVADLLNCDVYFKDKKIGKISDINNYGAADVVDVKTRRGEFSVPYVDDLVIELDIKNKKIVMDEKRFRELSGCELTF